MEWSQQIESIFHRALERDPAQRYAWPIEAAKVTASYSAKSPRFSRINMNVSASKIELRRNGQN
jgi:hypothetical protein